MMNESERYARLQLAFTPHLGAELYVALMAHFGSASEALRAPKSVIERAGRSGKKAAAAWHDTAAAQAAADAALQWEEQEGCTLLLSGCPDYPAMLGEGLTPPPVLFARGRVALLHLPAVAIVGSRHATPQAVRIARDFGAALSAAGIPVVSGMAAGIDTAAHQGALMHDGGTAAIWGTGINRIYPSENQQLAYRIAEQGVIVSEFPLDTRPLAGNFPRRNRLIAAQSVATLVVEAALQSGSLITARLAAEMGREVMAVPGSIDNPHSKGCHKLIKEGAKLVEDLDDILCECAALRDFSGSLKREQPLLKPKLSTELSTLISDNAANAETLPPTVFRQPESPMPSQTECADKPSAAAVADNLLEHMGYDPVHPDTLADTLQLPAAEVYALLTEWELEGWVAAMSGGRYQRIK